MTDIAIAEHIRPNLAKEEVYEYWNWESPGATSPMECWSIDVDTKRLDKVKCFFINTEIENIKSYEQKHRQKIEWYKMDVTATTKPQMRMFPNTKKLGNDYQTYPIPEDIPQDLANPKDIS